MKIPITELISISNFIPHTYFLLSSTCIFFNKFFFLLLLLMSWISSHSRLLSSSHSRKHVYIYVFYWNTHTWNFSACKLMAKQKVALECLSYHATAPIDQTVKLAKEPVRSAEEYKLYSFKFIGEFSNTTWFITLNLNLNPLCVCPKIYSCIHHHHRTQTLKLTYDLLLNMYLQILSCRRRKRVGRL